MTEYALIPYTNDYYEFVYEVKKNAYKNYVQECWGKWDEEVQREYFKKFIDTYKDNAYIIKIGEKTIGFFNDELLEDGSYEIGNICIIPEYQGRGIGTNILKTKLEENKDKDIKIQFFKQNPVGNLYKRLGFEISGETKFHYQMLKRKQEKFKFVVPSIEWKQKAIDYINEFYKYNSDINGTGGIQRYLDDYEGWLSKLEQDYTTVASEERVPARTYFLVRENDNRIVGMINIRLALNEKLKKYGGHIGYCIRPTERQKGYNKINLYLALKVCKEYGINEVLLDADENNPASWKTMEAFGGKCIRKYFDNEIAKCMVRDYIIDVNNAIESTKTKYEDMIV